MTPIEIQTTTIRLGEKDYTIREAPHLRAAPWNKRLIAEIKPLFEQISGAQEIQFNTAADLLQLWPMFEQIFTDALETVFEMLVTYSADLEADRDYIANHATNRQILAAFREVARLADPFDLVPMLTRQIGLVPTGTSSSLPAQNGAVRSRKRQR
jgi:hypothetical protein